MKLSALGQRRWPYLVLAFAFPVVCFLILMIIGGYSPFGNYSMLYMDAYHQYFPFFKAFRAALLNGESLLFSWDVGMGMDYLGLIAYYLASPLNLLSVLIPEGWVLGYYSLLVPIKLGLASLFFAIFLKKMFRRNDVSLVIFGSFYGMCAWALGYQWNIMWLDTFALLPLVALGTVSLLRDKKFFLYTVTLALSVFSNYYIGFFSCIFVLLVFICYQICRCRSVGRFFLDLGRIALFSGLAIGMTAILELPAFAALQTTSSSVNNFPDNFALNITEYQLCAQAREAWTAFKLAREAGEPTFALLLTALKESIPPVFEGMRQAAGNMGGGLSPTFVDGLPNLYCGVGTLFLAFVFLTCKQVKRRDRVCAVFMLAFLLLSFVVRQLDYIWHGFHFTNQIPYRFSFLYSFVVLYMAYRAWLLRRRIKAWQVLVGAALSIAIFCCSNSRTSSVFLAFNGIFLLLYAGFFLVLRMDRPTKDADKPALREYVASRKTVRRYVNLFMTATFLLELVLNMVNFSVSFPCTSVSNYPRGTEYTASMIRYMKEREDSLFYRVETTHTQTLNDGALNGYHGLTTFTSSANASVTQFAKALGFSAMKSWNRYCYEESSPVSNLFLNLKYLIERQGQVKENAYFDQVHHYGKVYLLENNAYLPLGFLAEPALAELNIASAVSGFSFQNRLFSAATGVNTGVWQFVPNSNLTLSGDNVTLNTQTVQSYCSYTAGSNGGKLTYTYTMNDTGLLCLDIDMPQKNSFQVMKNGTAILSESITLSQMFSVCDVVPGDVIEIIVSCKADENSSMTVDAAVLNEELFRQGYDVLNASTLELTHFSNTRIEGYIDCDRDGLLYTSIPQDGNWVATVDGQPAEITLIGEAMVGIAMTEGYHEVVFTYENQAFQTGSLITGGCVLVFLGISAAVYLPQLRKKKGKYSK